MFAPNSLPDKRLWYVITTRPRAEKQVSRRLAESGIEHFLPLQRQLRKWHDRRKWVDVPLFYSYIFVKTEERLRSKVFEVGGMVQYVSIGRQVAVLSEDEIERVRRLCSYVGEVVITQRESFAEGEQVEITEGHFAGLRGQVVQTAGKRKLKISIAALHCVAMVELDEERVSKVL